MQAHWQSQDKIANSLSRFKYFFFETPFQLSPSVSIYLLTCKELSVKNPTRWVGYEVYTNTRVSCVHDLPEEGETTGGSIFAGKDVTLRWG